MLSNGAWHKPDSAHLFDFITFNFLKETDAWCKWGKSSWKRDLLWVRADIRGFSGVYSWIWGHAQVFTLSSSPTPTELSFLKPETEATHFPQAEFQRTWVFVEKEEMLKPAHKSLFPSVCWWKPSSVHELSSKTWFRFQNLLTNADLSLFLNLGFFFIFTAADSFYRRPLFQSPGSRSENIQSGFRREI